MTSEQSLMTLTIWLIGLAEQILNKQRYNHCSSNIRTILCYSDTSYSYQDAAYEEMACVKVDFVSLPKPSGCESDQMTRIGKLTGVERERDMVGCTLQIWL